MKSAQKMKPICFASLRPCDNQARSRSVKVVEVNGAYRHGRYENIGLNSLCVMSNVKVVATQDGRTARRTNTTHCTDPFDTHMDQEVRRIVTSKKLTSSKLQCLISSSFCVLGLIASICATIDLSLNSCRRSLRQTVNSDRKHYGNV